jgi:hypothetical protein
MTASPTSTPSRRHAAIAVLSAGLVCSLLTFVVPLIDRARNGILVAHIRSGYPDYTETELAVAADLWLGILGGFGALAVACWVIGVVGTARRRQWALVFGIVALAIGLMVALTAMFVRDTSGDTGLPLPMSAIQLLPCLAGAIAVALLLPRRQVAVQL